MSPLSASDYVKRKLVGRKIGSSRSCRERERDGRVIVRPASVHCNSNEDEDEAEDAIFDSISV